MELPNLSVHFLVQELLPILSGSRISKIQAIGENKFKLKLSTKKGSQELLLLPNVFFLTSFRIPSSPEHQNFVLFLRKHLQGKRIISVSQKNWDRIIELEFEETKMILELFASGNIILIGKDRKIMACLHNEEWKDRKIRRNQEYKFPSAKPVPSEISFKEFNGFLKKTDKKIVPALLEIFNIFPALAEEAVFSSGITKNTSPSDLAEKKASTLHKNLKGFFSKKKPSPVIVKAKKEDILLPFSFAFWKKENKFDESTVSGLSQELDSFFASKITSREKKTIETAKNKQLQKLFSSLEQQKKALERFESQITENKNSGEWIFINYKELQEIGFALEKAEKKKVSDKKILETLQKSSFSGCNITKKIVDVNSKKKKAVFEI